MYCRHCGENINEKAEYCVHCGCNPRAGLKHCQECGIGTSDVQEICTSCGVRLLKENSISSKGAKDLNERFNAFVNGDKPVNENLNLSYLSPYYQAEFTKIHESKEVYSGKWNWAAFFFGTLWAIAKGLWLSVIVTIILNVITAGFASILIVFYYGFRGNKLCYNKHVKNQQTLF